MLCTGVVLSRDRMRIYLFAMKRQTLLAALQLCNWFENPRKIRTCISTATQILVVLKKGSDRSRICIVALLGGTYDVCVFIPYLADKTSIFEWSCQIEQDHPCSAGSLTLAETPLQAFHMSTYYR